MSLSDNEIIKALECCADEYIHSCDYCPFEKECNGDNLNLVKFALDLISRQKAEIEVLKERDETAEKIIREQGSTILHLKNENRRLMDRNFELSEKGEKAVIACLAAKAEAVKEFAEKVKASRDALFNTIYSGFHFNVIIDNLVKEMVGDAE